MRAVQCRLRPRCDAAINFKRPSGLILEKKQRQRAVRTNKGRGNKKVPEREDKGEPFSLFNLARVRLRALSYRLFPRARAPEENAPARSSLNRPRAPALRSNLSWRGGAALNSFGLSFLGDD